VIIREQLIGNDGFILGWVAPEPHEALADLPKCVGIREGKQFAIFWGTKRIQLSPSASESDRDAVAKIAKSILGWKTIRLPKKVHQGR
jgi:hypothetical protein